MTRILLQYLLPLILPTLVYLLWVRIAGRARTVEGVNRLASEGPWLWLIVAGVVLMGAVLAASAWTGGSGPTGTYVAPRWEGGRVVPGHVVPQPGKRADPP